MKKQLTKAQEFCSKVKDLATCYNIPFFVVTEGASATFNKNSKAVANARKAHIQWEKAHKIDPNHDWEKDN
ncbi:MAG: hypothetical protein II942_03065 [Alphaproteobacteria bacterium]|nr:hypothetical protein [Alphaproteobacteria bacterium]